MAKFSDIYNEYARQVFRFMLSLTRDEHLAEELTQDTFYKAFLNIHKFRGDCSIYSWLCQIAKNNYFNESKRRKRFAAAALPAARSDPESFVKALEDRKTSSASLEFYMASPNPIRVFLHSGFLVS